MQYRTRPAPCTHCGDTVLIGEHPPLKVFGYTFGKTGPARLEHADPSAEGELFDDVDDACHRPRVNG